MKVRKWVALSVALAVLFAIACGGKPVAIDPRLKAKLALRLADGSPISQDGSDEYNPHLLKLPNNYLALVFGSNRSCAASCVDHNLFVASSLTPFNGETLPFFSTPVPVTLASTAWLNQAAPINFTARVSGSSVVVYVNVDAASGGIQHVEVQANGEHGTTALDINNTIHQFSTVIGIAADGERLIVLDSSYEAYEINPSISSQGTRVQPLDYADTAVGVRQENSGVQNGYFGSYFGASFAATDTQPIGPLITLDIGLGESGLTIWTLNTFFQDNAVNDIVLFTAFDGTSEDMYVLTSHTAGDLWDTTGFFSFEAFLPEIPEGDVYLEYENSLANTGANAWTATNTGVTFSSGAHVAGNYSGNFNGSSYFSFGTQNVGDTFTIASWVKPSSSSSTYTIAANSGSASNAAGFRFYIVQPDLKIVFETGDGTNGSSAEAALVPGPGDLFAPGEWHHVAVQVDRLNGYALIFVDGAVAGSGPVNTSFTTSAALRFGSATDGSNFLTGELDETYYFSRALDPLEVMVLSMIDRYQAPP
jgi:hypothetical protein